MPNITTYKFGDIILVPFPFTDQITTKKRPAAVISSEEYNNGRPDLIIMAITGRLHQVNKLGACPRIDILFKIEEFSKNKHSHICDIASIIF